MYTFFHKQKDLDPDFYFAIQIDNNGILQSVFWADKRSRNDYFTFGDVIVFDVTYKTNKFMMPFASFTGVNHHRQSILFGCALLSDETEESFVWLFNEWLKCMLGTVYNVIITDMDAAMYKAIQIVFPNTRHRFCSWHIGKHLVEHVHNFRDNDNEFKKDYYTWFNSISVNSCEHNWCELVSKHKINDNTWLAKMWHKRMH
ncbi:Protein FAR1-RELATED SEQUENCE 5 [Platanthera zijinensis]|uniref:Protein FAR1-RELATED SEQUENCE 5 n=1 Tax=Platanthera zijinensis TaxID=2320716 RepID=A0AAP0BFV6_9ASPA